MNQEWQEKFTIVCNDCGKSDVTIDFYEGCIHEFGGDTGSLSIICINCGSKIDVEGKD